MSQAEAIRLEPNLKRFSEQELYDMKLEISKLVNMGRMKEADILINKIPLHWKSAKILKEMVGIEAMIESGTNLSEAVEHYGMGWLER